MITFEIESFLTKLSLMKGFIAVLLIAAFGCGTFTCYADVGSKAKTEVVKKSHDLVAIEVNHVIDVDAPAVQPINHITGEVNVKAISRPKEAVANAPPIITLEQSPNQSNRIRAVTW
jgi:hypothetical protein